MTTTTMPDRPTFASLLETAVTQPGMIARAYSAFHSFSFGNQLLAATQCAERGLALGPLASFQTWKGKGRYVRRGERALWLWMPLTVKRTVVQDDGSDRGSGPDEFDRNERREADTECHYRVPLLVPISRRNRSPD